MHVREHVSKKIMTALEVHFERLIFVRQIKHKKELGRWVDGGFDMLSSESSKSRGKKVEFTELSKKRWIQ